MNSCLPRILEPEVMDTFEEATEYDSMDHSEVNRNFVDNLLGAGINLPGTDEELLDLGTGTALIPIELCRRQPTCRVVAVDLSTQMLDLARLRIEIAGLTDRVRLQRIDAKALPFPDETFAAVMSNSIVHHIPEPAGVLAEAVRVTRPGGLLFFRDLIRPDTAADVARLVDLYAAGATDHQRLLFDNSLRAALRLEEIQELVAALGFSPDSVRRSSDRHWTWSARKVLHHPER